MRVRERTSIIVTLLLLMATGCLAQDKVTLALRAKAGQTMRYKFETILTADIGGTKQEMKTDSTYKVTVAAVSASGDITLERQDESSETTVGGEKMPQQDGPKITRTFNYHPDGSLFGYKTSDPDDKEKTLARLNPGQKPFFQSTPVGVGDKWSHEFKADADLGRHAGKADYEVLAYEKVKDIDTVKLKLTYQETEGEHAVRSNSIFWVEKKSGDVVQADLQMDNLPFGGGQVTVTGKIHVERTEGNPLEGAKVEDKPKDKTIDEVVKDYEKLPGLFTLYHKREGTRDSIYLEIKESQLDKPLLLEVTASTGTSEQVVAGTPINDILFKFSKSPDDRILVVTPNINFRADEKSPIARAVHRSFADAYLEVYKVEAKQPDRKSLLIDVSDLFRGDIAQISSLFRSSGGSLLAMLGGGGSSYTLDRDKTMITRLKSYPENLSVETSYHFTGSGGGGGLAQLLGGGDVLADSRSIPFKVSYTLFPLDDNGYRPRLYDPRVGYFIAEYQSFDNDAANDPNIRYINRWQLDKADPKAALSEPKKPIVFWLDNAIPTEYRDAVREGILMWNKAFERIGFKNAIVVKQMPDNADWDHADMRYNTIRWVTSVDAGYAVAQARVNPLTGQVINANITVDSSWTHYIKSERAAVVAPSSYFEQMMPPKDPVQALKAAVDPSRCDLAAETGEQAWVGDLAMQMLSPAGAKVDEKAYVHSHLREVVCHEMGHILGLRHNFIASTYHSLDELRNANVVKNTGVSASVMDYIPFNISALKTTDVPFYQDTVGPYDMWAIKYGYLPIDASTPQGEVYKLSQIATQCNEPGHAYESDEVADGFDPAVIRYDLGSNSLAYFERSMDLSRFLLLHLSEREPKQGESYWEFTRDFNRLLGYYVRNAAFVSRYIGGLHVNRNQKGDANEKPTLVPIAAAEQKRALNLLNTYVFAANAFTMPSSYYTHLTSNPGANFIQSLFSPKDYPIRDTLSRIQESGLQYVFSPTVLRRISNNEFKVSDTLTLPTLFHSVGGTVWSELETKSNIGPLHRQLQRTHLDTMIAMVIDTSNSAPEDARMLAWDQLRRLQTGIRLAQARPHDEYTRLHLDESLMRIQRALNAQQVIGGGDGGPNSLSALLGGMPTKK